MEGKEVNPNPYPKVVRDGSLYKIKTSDNTYLEGKFTSLGMAEIYMDSVERRKQKAITKRTSDPKTKGGRPKKTT